MKALLLVSLLAGLSTAGVMNFGNNATVVVADVNGQAIAPATVTASTVTVSPGTGAKCFSADDPTLVVNCNTHTVSFSGSTMTVLSNGNVGIGVSAPLQPLEIVNNGGSSVTDNLIQIQTSGDGGIGRFFGIDTVNDLMYDRMNDDATYGWAWQSSSGNNNLMTLARQSSSVGFLGVGTTGSPASKIHMSSGTLTIDGNAGGLNVTAPSATFSASTPVTISSAAFVGTQIAVSARGSAGTAQTVSCPANTFAQGGGCDCTVEVAETSKLSVPSPTTSGSVPVGWTCQSSGGTGGQCIAYAICSRLQ